MPSMPSGGTALTSAAARSPGAFRPGLARHQTDAEAAGAEQQLAAFEDAGGLRGVGHRHGVHRAAETLLDVFGELGAALRPGAT